MASTSVPRRRTASAVSIAIVLAFSLASCSSGGAEGGGDSAGSSTGSPSDTRAPSSVSTVTSVVPKTTTVPVRPAVAPRAKTIDGTLTTPDGRTRTYHLYVPSTVAAGPAGKPLVPLLVALHGGTGWGTQFERNSGFDGMAEANGFIVVYPDGVGTGPDGTTFRTWNGGACCGVAARDDVDDVTFIKMLIAKLRQQYAIDQARVFATGHSNGGILAYRLACELSDEIVAIGVQSTSLEIPTCAPSSPVSLLHIHGTGDENIPIGGGKGPQAISGVAFNPPLDGVEKVASADGCDARPTESADATNADVITKTWANCDGAVEVQFMTVAGAPHAWMGHDTFNGANANPSMAIDATAVIWTFLSAHGR